MGGEDDNAYTKRLTGYTDRVSGTDQYPYDHRRGRECALGYHLTCSSRHGGNGCGCPCHAEPHPITEVLPTSGRDVEDAADILADLYYLPKFTAWQAMFDTAETVRRGLVMNQAGLRSRLSKRFKSPIGPWFVADVASVLAKHVPDLPRINQ